METLSIITLITAIIGSLTGIISLGWHISNSKPKLIIESIYFRKEPVVDDYDGRIQHIRVKITIRNLGNRSSTIEDISTTLGNRVSHPEFNLPLLVKANSSEIIDYYLNFEEKEFKELYPKNGKLYFEVLVEHTFNTIRKKGYSDFSTGHFTIK